MSVKYQTYQYVDSYQTDQYVNVRYLPDQYADC